MERISREKTADREERCKRLMTELQNGIIKRDVLLNSSYRFSGEVASNYMSHMKIFMKSSLGNMIMHSHADCAEVEFLNRLRGTEYGK